MLITTNNQFSDKFNNTGGLLSSVLLLQIIFTFKRWLEAEALLCSRRVLLEILKMPLFDDFSFLVGELNQMQKFFIQPLCHWIVYLYISFFWRWNFLIQFPASNDRKMFIYEK